MVLAVVLAGMSAVVSPAQAISGGGPVPAGQSGFVARVNLGDVHGCYGALVAPRWVPTADTCFAFDVGAGAPRRPTRVTVGGNDLPVVLIRPHSSRNLVLAKLSLRVPNVSPVAVSGDGQQAGYGHPLTAVVDTASGSSTEVVVSPSGSTQVGVGADPDSEPTTLLQLRVPS